MKRPLLVVLLLALAIGLFVAARRRAPETAAPQARASASRPVRARAERPRRALAAGLHVLRGRVVTHDGAPIPNAEIAVRRMSKPPMLLAEADTGLDGTFEVVVPAGTVLVVARATGFLTDAARASAPGAEVVVTLSRGFAITGRVVLASTGEPVAGAFVEPGRPGVRVDPARTDPLGRFRIEGLPQGMYHPSAEREALFGRTPASVWVSGESSEITIPVGPVASLRARLEVAPSHTPCPGGTVELRSTLAGNREATADEQGNVVFPALLPARYEVELSCPDRARGELAPPLVVGDAPLTATFAVHDQPRITGIVVDERGEPAGDYAMVSAISPGGTIEHPDASVAVRHDGRFTMFGVQPGTYEVWATTWSGPVHVAPVSAAVVAGAPPPDIRIVRKERFVLEGRVVDEQGRPLAGATVQAFQSGHEDIGRAADEDGSFVIAALAPGEARLSVNISSITLLIRENGTVKVPAGRPVTVVAARPPDSIRGRVSRGADPVARADVRVTCENRASFFDVGMTGADGRFEQTVPRDSACAVSVTLETGESASAEPVRAGANVELRLSAPAVVSGTITNAPPVFRVWLTGSGHEQVFFGTGGSWEFHGVPAGETAVEATAEGLGARREIVVAPGSTTRVTLTLTPGGEHADMEDP